MKTEAEAKKCWCPFVRAVPIAKDGLVTQVSAFNRYGTETDNEMDTKQVGQCIASECMAWRWTTLMTPYQATAQMMADRTGFCGLAGPQL